MGNNEFNIEGTNNNTPFWFNDIYILFKPDKLDKFIPTKDMNYVEKNNALVRLGIYTGILFQHLLKIIYIYIFQLD